MELSTGRIVVVVHDYPVQGVWQYNNGLPYVVYSDDGGQTWDPDTEVPVRVATESGIVPAMSGDTPHGIDRNSCAPAIAVDPDSDDVYVAFYARAVRYDNSSGDRNSDIYISKSRVTNGELSFPGDNPAYLVQLTDQMLGLNDNGSGPDQVMPSIAVDPCGGVSLVFYDNRRDDNRNDNVDKYDVYFVRITDYGNGNNIQQMRLTPDSFTPPTDGGFLGDYHHMASAGPVGGTTLYPAWIAMYNNRQNCYLNKIRVLCSTELSAFMAGQEDSCELFERLYKDGTIDGDLNGDEVVDHEDEEIFAALVEGMKE